MGGVVAEEQALAPIEREHITSMPLSQRTGDIVRFAILGRPPQRMRESEPPTSCSEDHQRELPRATIHLIAALVFVNHFSALDNSEQCNIIPERFGGLQ